MTENDSRITHGGKFGVVDPERSSQSNTSTAAPCGDNPLRPCASPS